MSEKVFLQIGRQHAWFWECVEKEVERFLERLWLDFGKILKNEGGRALNFSSTMHVKIGEGLTSFPRFFLCQDPRAVSRSPAERPNTRGSPPRVVK